MASPSAFRMLIKEYHILLPMSLDEYQVAQLYMIQVRAVRRETGVLQSGLLGAVHRAWDQGFRSALSLPVQIRVQGPEWKREAACQRPEQEWGQGA